MVAMSTAVRPPGPVMSTGRLRSVAKAAAGAGILIAILLDRKSVV